MYLGIGFGMLMLIGANVAVDFAVVGPINRCGGAEPGDTRTIINVLLPVLPAAPVMPVGEFGRRSIRS